MQTQVRLLLLFLTIFALIALWWPTVNHMVTLLWTVDSYSHGLIVPLISIGLIWSRRTKIAAKEFDFDLLGALAIGAAVLLWLVSQVLDTKLLAHIALVSGILALVLCMLGRKFFMQFFFPLCFLYLAIPVGDSLIPILQTVTAKLVIAVLPVFGIPYEAEGVLLKLPSGWYEVARACAGIKFLFTSLVTGVLLAHLAYRKWSSRLIIILFAGALPVFANALRVLGILLIAENTDQEFAKGVDHLVYGWGFLSVILLILISVAYRFSDVQSDEELASANKASIAPSSVTRPWIVLVTCFGSIGVGVWLAPEQNPAAALLNTSIVAPECSDCDYRLLERNASPMASWRGADDSFEFKYRTAADTITISGALYCPQRPGSSLLQIGNMLAGQGWEALPGVPNMDVAVGDWKLAQEIYWRGSERRVVWSGYLVNNAVEVSRNRVKLATAIERLKNGKSAGAIYAIILPAESAFVTDQMKLKSFLSTFPLDRFLWDGLKPNDKGQRLCVA